MIFYSSLKEKYRGKKWSVGSSGVLTLDLTLNLPSCLIGGGNGTPLQRSCLENPMDGGGWWAAVRGVATSRTRLSGLAVAAAV